ncbi:hypothetical protein [Flavobacterium pallidum]|uniref:Uncharacterized protein n=1 Tax=Flavobacterium pallidum TaxID=2172098 RepID=A0A2S1SDY2_9FLAO|nr:hypothetical protein [Flavobacterium pallidum]AWI24608.1 hypothetical protein HYN49_01160 [Flavobacterium pallidum]
MEIAKTHQPFRKMIRIFMITIIFAHLLLQMMHIKIPVDHDYLNIIVLSLVVLCATYESICQRQDDKINKTHNFRNSMYFLIFVVLLAALFFGLEAVMVPSR